MKTVAVILAIAALMAAGGPAEARTKSFAPHVHKPRAPKGAYKTVRIRRADGTVVTGYRDSLGTHLHEPGGRTVTCRRQTFSAADIDVACR